MTKQSKQSFILQKIIPKWKFLKYTRWYTRRYFVIYGLLIAIFLTLFTDTYPPILVPIYGCLLPQINYDRTQFLFHNHDRDTVFVTFLTPFRHLLDTFLSQKLVFLRKKTLFTDTFPPILVPIYGCLVPQFGPLITIALYPNLHPQPLNLYPYHPLSFILYL